MSAQIALFNVITAVFAALSGPSGAPQAVSAEYRFLVDDPYLAEVDCSLRLTGLAGPIELALPERTAFAVLAEPRLGGEVRLVGPGTLEREGPYLWRLTPEGPSAQLTWTVPLDHHALPEVQGDEYQFPYLDETHGMLTMGTLALAPTRAEPGTIHVSIEVPPDWPLITPWPEVEPAEADSAGAHPAVFELDGWGPLQDDLVAFGDWRVEEADAGGVALKVAVAGEQPVVQALALERIVPLVEAEVELFGGPQHASYLFLFPEPRRSGYGGSPRNTSMTLYVSRDLPADFVREGLTHLIAHEYHHTWMKATGFDPRGLRFFAEGFTDWYSYLVPWWLGFQGADAVERMLEGKLFEYEDGLARFDGSLLEAGGPAFFEGRSTAYKTTYAGGLVLAAWLDLAIAQAHPDGGRSLDTLMRDMYGSLGDTRWGDGRDPGLDDLVRLVEESTDAEQAGRFRAMVQTTEPPDLVAAFAAVGVELTRAVGEPTYSLRANFDGATVEAIDGAGMLARVGVATGDRLVSVNGRAVTSEREIRAAFGPSDDGRVRLTLVRAGSEAEERIDVPVPPTVTYSIRSGSLQPCMRRD